MSVQLKDLLAQFESLWPTAGAEAWDAPGLVTGAASQRVSRVLLTVDVTSEILDEAIDGKFDLVLAHHPFIMRGVSSLSEQTAKGALLAKAIRAGVAIFAAHTNADIVENGVSDTIAKKLGLQDVAALAPAGQPIGHGRVGNLPTPIKLGEFARFLAQVLPSTASGVRVSGDYERVVSRVALCGGAGDSFIDAAFAAEACVYVTSDLRHHPAQDAKEAFETQGVGPALIDVSHWASEWLWLDSAAEQLQSKFSGIQFLVSQIRTDPWDFVVTQ